MPSKITATTTRRIQTSIIVRIRVFIFLNPRIVFFWIYVAEYATKVLGVGLLNVLLDFWNFYDLFTLIVYGLFIFDQHIMPYDLSALRAMRRLIFLGKMINSLKIMLLSISEAMKFLLEALLIVNLFAIFFSNVGLHLFSGIFNI